MPDGTAAAAASRRMALLPLQLAALGAVLGVALATAALILVRRGLGTPGAGPVAPLEARPGGYAAGWSSVPKP